jgi:pSer/pThr/pTyr-binding forkhead associated (FHA) protein
MLYHRGPATSAEDPLTVAPSIRFQPVLRESTPEGGIYTLVSLADGRRQALRAGINAIGRCVENDLVLQPDCVSRRHCVVLVHATGGCEVYDTASLNGTFVNGLRVARTGLLSGDILTIASQHFLVEWVESTEERPRTSQESITDLPSGLSTTF